MNQKTLYNLQQLAGYCQEFEANKDELLQLEERLRWYNQMIVEHANSLLNACEHATTEDAGNLSRVVQGSLQALDTYQAVARRVLDSMPNYLAFNRELSNKFDEYNELND
jgi:hypothetical protein